MIVICAGLWIISAGYNATAIIRGKPYGTHCTAAVPSGSPRFVASSSAARRASYGFAYSGFSTIGVGGGGFNFGSAPRPARYGAHTPDRPGGVEAATCPASATKSTVGPVPLDPPAHDVSRLPRDATGT